MCKSKQTASSTKLAGSARKGTAAGKKRRQLKSARQGRRATEAEPQLRTKQARVIALLERETGATLAKLVAATSWLPHTTRAALTGLRVRDDRRLINGDVVFRPMTHSSDEER